MFAVIFIGGNLLLCIAGKTAKIAKIRTRQKFLPHGSHNETQGTRENWGVTNSQNKLVNTLHKRYRNGSGKSSVSGTVSGIGSGNGIGIVISSVVIVVWIVVVVIVIVIVIVIAMTAAFYSIAKACFWQSKYKTNSTNNNLEKLGALLTMNHVFSYRRKQTS